MEFLPQAFVLIRELDDRPLEAEAAASETSLQA